ncbi:arabinose kinase [Clostridium sp. CTA-5]
MKTIAFYISDHGFGHASRNIPIIRYILEVYKNIKVIIKTGKNQGEFIKNLLNEFHDRVDYYFEDMDAGLVLKEGSLDIDKVKLENNVLKYINSFEEKVTKENEFLHYYNVDLIVSDIVPWIFKCSNKLNIPSILISNFTWVDIYKEHLSEEICEKYKQCYKLADKAFLYLLYIETMKSYLNNFEQVGLCCRSFNEESINNIKKEHTKKIIFISVGRSVELKNSINVENLNYDFIVTEGINIVGSNVTYLPKEITNTQDYIKASDYVITKAGWGTVAEVLCANKRCAVLSRNSIAEDRKTIEKLKSMNLAVEVKYEENFNIENILKDLNKLNINNKDYKFKNQYKDIANKIMSYIGER